MEQLHKDWYDHVLKGRPVPRFLKDRVACFITGRNEWAYAYDLKAFEGERTKFMLDIEHAVPGDVTRGGLLSAEIVSSHGEVTLTADPMMLGSREIVNVESEEPLRDQTDDFSTGGYHIVLHTAPMSKETIFTGRPSVTLRLAVDQPDADVSLTLYEIGSDGRATYLSSGMQRLRYRKPGSATPMVPGHAEDVTISSFDFFARSVAKGSRIRLSVSVGPTFGFQRNTNTGGDLAVESLRKSRVAKVTLITGPDISASLTMPRPTQSVLDTLTKQ